MNLEYTVLMVWAAAIVFSIFMSFRVGGIYFKNKNNNFIENVNEGGLASLLCMLFGPIYFAIKGNWRICFVYIAFAVPLVRFTDSLAHTHMNSYSLLVGIFGSLLAMSWIILPFFVHHITKIDCLRRGLIRVNKDGSPFKTA